MQKTVLIILCLISTSILSAQPEARHIDKITVPVVNEQKKALPYATVELLRGKDSVLVKASITDSSGLAIFEQVNDGVYLIRVSIVNYTPQHTAPCFNYH